MLGMLKEFLRRRKDSNHKIFRGDIGDTIYFCFKSGQSLSKVVFNQFYFNLLFLYRTTIKAFVFPQVGDRGVRTLLCLLWRRFSAEGGVLCLLPPEWLSHEHQRPFLWSRKTSCTPELWEDPLPKPVGDFRVVKGKFRNSPRSMVGFGSVASQ